MSKSLYIEYIDALDKLGRCYEYIRTLINENESLKADPFLALKNPIWGIRAIKRVSEWDQLWDEKMQPILDTAGIKMERPWLKTVRRAGQHRVYATKKKQVTKKGVLKIDRKS